VRAGRLMHGKVSPVHHDGRGILEGMPQPFEAGRYHSLIARPESLPPVLEVTARTPEGEIMGVRHTELMVEGVQFHPESVLTPEGPVLLGNFLRQRGGRDRTARRTRATAAAARPAGAGGGRTAGRSDRFRRGSRDVGRTARRLALEGHHGRRGPRLRGRNALAGAQAGLAARAARDRHRRHGR